MTIRHHILLSAAVSAGILAGTAGCGGSLRRPVSPYPTPPRTAVREVMANSRLTASQLATWFLTRGAAATRYRATVPVETLAEYYIEEGAAEGVAGDIAFIQAVVETGWFGFPGAVRPEQNNFAGIGATGRDRGASFPDARTGVRAQIQHLRAYADPSAQACRTPPLRLPCVDPRFDLVFPKGRAPRWNDMGNGNWASSPGYAATILRLYEDALNGR